MDTNLRKEQMAFIANEIQDQSVMQSKRFKLLVNSRLIERFGDSKTAFNKVLHTLLWLQKNQDKDNRAITLHTEKKNGQERWFDITIEKDFKEFVRQVNDRPDESLKFDSRNGVLLISGKKFDIDPGSRKSTILRLCFHRLGGRVGFNRVSDSYDETSLLSDKQIYDDVKSLNKMINNQLPEITELIKLKKGYVSINREQVT